MEYENSKLPRFAIFCCHDKMLLAEQSVKKQLFSSQFWRAECGACSCLAPVRVWLHHHAASQRPAVSAEGAIRIRRCTGGQRLQELPCLFSNFITFPPSLLLSGFLRTFNPLRVERFKATHLQGHTWDTFPGRHLQEASMSSSAFSGQFGEVCELLLN